MSLLNKIQAQLNLPEQPKPTPAEQPATFQGVDIDQRDAFIAACMAVRTDGKAQAAIWQAMSQQGMNMATLTAAVKVICRYNDAELIKRYGSAGMEPVELRTAKEWSEMSGHKARNPET